MILGKNSAFNIGGLEKIRLLYEEKLKKKRFPCLSMGSKRRSLKIR